MRQIAKTIFKNIDFCIVPSKQILDNACKIIDKNKIMIIGDSRFDQIFNRYQQNKNLSLLPDYFEETKNIIFGSYDSIDEKLIIESLVSNYSFGSASLKQAKTRIILVPHEPSTININRMIKKLKKYNFEIEKLSELEKKSKSNLIIINQVGILADLYKHSHLAYVGAGFGRGVHSVIEPAVYNCIISFGPNIEMLNEAKDLYANNLDYMIYNKEDLVKFINLNPNDSIHNEMKNNLNYYMKNNQNCSNQILEKILEIS